MGCHRLRDVPVRDASGWVAGRMKAARTPRGLQRGARMELPQLGGKGPALGIGALACEIAANIGDIAGQQPARMGIAARIDGLWQIDHPQALARVEQIVGRQIAVHHVARP